MKLRSVLSVSALAVAGATHAVALAAWNFNTATDATTLFTPSFTNLALSKAAMDSSFTSVTSFSGSAINAYGSDAAGSALALVNQTNNGESLTFSVTRAAGVSLSAYSVSFATQKTATGFSSDQFQYSTDGVNFVNFGNPYNPATAFALQSFDLSSVVALNTATTATFRIVFNGNTSGSGNNRIDNLQVGGTIAPQAVPEPSAFAALGLGALALTKRRKRA